MGARLAVTFRIMVPFVRAASRMVAIYAREDLRVPPPNYALEQSVKCWWVGASGALEIIAPAAPSLAVSRPAQRERWTASHETGEMEGWV